MRPLHLGLLPNIANSPYLPKSIPQHVYPRALNVLENLRSCQLFISLLFWHDFALLYSVSFPCGSKLFWFSKHFDGRRRLPYQLTQLFPSGIHLLSLKSYQVEGHQRVKNNSQRLLMHGPDVNFVSKLILLDYVVKHVLDRGRTVIQIV